MPRDRLSWSLIVLFAAWATTAFGVMNLLPSFYREAGTDPTAVPQAPRRPDPGVHAATSGP
jgi:hypothetical protein